MTNMMYFSYHAGLDKSSTCNTCSYRTGLGLHGVNNTATTATSLQDSYQPFGLVLPRSDQLGFYQFPDLAQCC